MSNVSYMLTWIAAFGAILFGVAVLIVIAGVISERVSRRAVERRYVQKWKLLRQLHANLLANEAAFERDEPDILTEEYARIWESSFSATESAPSSKKAYPPVTVEHLKTKLAK